MMTRWRLIIDDDADPGCLLTAEEVAEHLWECSFSDPWMEPADGGPGCAATEEAEVRQILLREPSRIAHAWLEHQWQPRWLYGWVSFLAEEYPEELWPVVMELVRVARDHDELAVVAAGPLEDLLAKHGPQCISKVERTAATDEVFRLALTGVWRSTITEGVWTRLEAACSGGPTLDGPAASPPAAEQ